MSLITLPTEPLNMYLPHVKRIHFIGILGVGMSGIAKVMRNKGYLVSGSDIKESAEADVLRELGVEITIGHRIEAVLNANVVVISSAISEDNVELSFAREHSIPVVPRAHILGELMRETNGIAVAGAHGKTTVTSLMAHMFITAGLMPSYVIGGRFLNTNDNAKLDIGDFLIAEADESDNSFLSLLPRISVITNIDNDHLATFDYSMEKLKESFVSFIHRLPFYGVAVVCGDDPIVQELIPKFQRKVVTYGSHESHEVRLLSISSSGKSSEFQVSIHNKEYRYQLQLAGRHNVTNALSVIAVASVLGIEQEVVSTSFSSFPGIRRRFQLHDPITHDNRSIAILEDYAHHPLEISATLDAARDAFPGARMLLLFQPHRYSRTKQLFNEFVQSLKGVDRLILLEVYSAGEAFEESGSSEKLYQTLQTSMGNRIICAKDPSDVVPAIIPMLDEIDMVLVFGAGDVSNCITILQNIEHRS